ncbi:MAG: glycoside hydrolase family 3 N-terminal domain-containing protein [Gemmatimonadota bacterium]
MNAPSLPPRRPSGSGVSLTFFGLLLLAGAASSGARGGSTQSPSDNELIATEGSFSRESQRLEWVDSTLARLDLRQRVGQLIVPWINGGEIPEGSAEFRRIRRWIEAEQVGGLIVSRGPASEFAPMMNRLQARAAVPLLIVSDLETGPGMRLRGGTDMPPAMAFGAAGSADLAFEAGRATAVEARAAGIHMTLGPVLDVNSNPFNPIINTRSFGEDPERVGVLASAWIAGAGASGLLTAGKHFPGHGATEVDSHMGLPSLALGLDELESLDLVPFRAGIESGMDAVLVGHIALPALDGAAAPPASLSPGIVGGLLRDQLGFDGVVLTDALNMGAITGNYDVPEAAIRAILAGADLLLQPPGTGEVIDAIVAAVRAGRIPQTTIDESARRVLLAKASAGLAEPGGVHAPGGRPPPSHLTLAARVAATSITLVRDDDGLVPLSEHHGWLLHIAYEASGTRFRPGVLNRELRLDGRRVEEAGVGPRTSAAEYRSLAERARSADIVLVSSNLTPREFRGQLALQDAYSRFVEDLIRDGVPVVALSMGSPYLLDFFPSVSSFLLAWSGSPESQNAAADALLGRAPIKGRLPVSLPPFHQLGEGISREPPRPQ